MSQLQQRGGGGASKKCYSVRTRMQVLRTMSPINVRVLGKQRPNAGPGLALIGHEARMRVRDS